LGAEPLDAGAGAVKSTAGHDLAKPPPFSQISRNILTATIEYQPHQYLKLFNIHLMAFYLTIFEHGRLAEINKILTMARAEAAYPCLIPGSGRV
jgi:hypothetical protein